MTRFGIDRLLAEPELRQPLEGQRVALLAHPASVTRDLTHSLDALVAAGVNLTAAFGPQHGLRGDKQDNMMESLDFNDPALGVQVRALGAAPAQVMWAVLREAQGGVLASMDDLKGVTDPSVLASLQDGFFLSDFGVYQVEIVGPQVGSQLRKQAFLATVYSLGGMLVYLAFRFELIYGVAAVITVFHDTLITLGAFSLTNKPISLTVIAAILTLIGYSNNDTIVVFDRIRENLKLMRREKLADVVNRSINQTLSRTILTAGLTFLTVLALFLFGGEVLHGFSFALVIGILIGTYSSIAIAAPILVAYQDWRSNRNKPPVIIAGGGTGRTGGPVGRREKAKA